MYWIPILRNYWNSVRTVFSEESMKRSTSFTRLSSAVGFATVWAATPQ